MDPSDSDSSAGIRRQAGSAGSRQAGSAQRGSNSRQQCACNTHNRPHKHGSAAANEAAISAPASRLRFSARENAARSPSPCHMTFSARSACVFTQINKERQDVDASAAHNALGAGLQSRLKYAGTAEPSHIGRQAAEGTRRNNRKHGPPEP